MSDLRALIAKMIQRAAGLRRAVRFVWESSPRWTLAGIVLLVLQGVLPVVSLYMMKLMIDAISAVLGGTNGDGNVQHVFVIIALAGVVALASNVVQALAGFVNRVQGRMVVDYMNDIIQQKAMDVDLAYYEDAQYHDTLHRAQQEASYRPVMIVNGLTQVLRSAVSLLGVAWLLLAFHWGVVVFLLLAVVPGILSRVAHSRRQYALQRAITADERKSWYYHWMTISIEYAKELRMFGLGATILKRFRALRSRIRQDYNGLDLFGVRLSLLAQIISTAAIYGTYGWIALRTLQGGSTLGDLVMYYQAFQRGQSFLQDMLGGVAKLYENSLFLTNLYEFLDLDRTLPVMATPLPIPRPMKKGISIEGVHFTYPGGAREVLRGVDMEIGPGEVIALVGENGSGKTTLVKLLCRLYDPAQGCVRIDGDDLRQFDPLALRREISVIFQDYAHYNLSVRDNIWFGNVARPADDELVQAAAIQAEADTMIQSLEKGYDTTLGKNFAHGTELSVGQWQKIALARAFFRQSQMIILDEPTSALDPNAEYEVFLKFRELLGGRTALLISHRLSTVRMADRIYVLEGGQIVETGTHDELVYRHGKYAHLFEKQASSYR